MEFEKKLIELATNMKEYVKEKPSTNKGNYFTYIFLCGGYIYSGDNREILKNILIKRQDIKCLYSEKLFTNFDFDLLSFEELLVEHSTNVVIILESYGSACELGAFTYTNKLLKKIIVINNKDHKGKHTFINDGPIKKIQEYDENNVFFEEFIHVASKERPVLIVSQNLYKRLFLDIPKEKNFKIKSIDKENKTLIIKDIQYFQIVIFEILNFFGPLEISKIIILVKILYDVDKIIFNFESGNKISSDDNDKFYKLLDFLLTLQVEFEILFKENELYYIKFSSLINSELDFFNKNSLLFKSSYLSSKKFLKDKSRAIFLAKKRGLNIWQN